LQVFAISSSDRVRRHLVLLNDLLSFHLSIIHLVSILFWPSFSLYSFSVPTLRRSHSFHFACFRRVLFIITFAICICPLKTCLWGLSSLWSPVPLRSIILPLLLTAGTRHAIIVAPFGSRGTSFAGLPILHASDPRRCLSVCLLAIHRRPQICLFLSAVSFL
jgi:hypothetical protein